MSGGTPAEFLDAAKGGEQRQSRSGHYVPVPELWVLGIIRNPAKPEWRLRLREEFAPLATSCCAAWVGDLPDRTWSCSPNSREVIFIRYFAELREGVHSARNNECKRLLTTPTQNALSYITSNVHVSSSESRESSDEFVTQEPDRRLSQNARIVISLRKGVKGANT